MMNDNMNIEKPHVELTRTEIKSIIRNAVLYVHCDTLDITTRSELAANEVWCGRICEEIKTTEDIVNKAIKVTSYKNGVSRIAINPSVFCNVDFKSFYYLKSFVKLILCMMFAEEKYEYYISRFDIAADSYRYDMFNIALKPNLTFMKCFQQKCKVMDKDTNFTYDFKNIPKSFYVKKEGYRLTIYNKELKNPKEKITMRFEMRSAGEYSWQMIEEVVQHEWIKRLMDVMEAYNTVLQNDNNMLLKNYEDKLKKNEGWKNNWRRFAEDYQLHISSIGQLKSLVESINALPCFKKKLKNIDASVDKFLKDKKSYETYIQKDIREYINRIITGIRQYFSEEDLREMYWEF